MIIIIIIWMEPENGNSKAVKTIKINWTKRKIMKMQMSEKQ